MGRLLNEADATQYIGGKRGGGTVSPRTMQDWRVKGAGPAYIKLGKRVAYDTDDLDKWLLANRVEPKQGLTGRVA